GLQTVGQLLSHLQRDNRLIVHVLIDGQEPDLTRLPALRQSPLQGHTLFIETTEPQAMAMEVLGEVEHQLNEANRLAGDAVTLLRSNQTVRAMEKLRGCFSTWQNAQESVKKTAQLLRIDLTRIVVEGKTFTDTMDCFTQQLRLIKTALENRDFVSLIDTLVYECAETSSQWLAAINSMRSVIRAV
ncbi:MAG: hypothetical protein JO353_06670, partial [Phycisphaerae bacterium]|nr:hypothetical protein [Phycisphaerae bacterium]